MWSYKMSFQRCGTSVCGCSSFLENCHRLTGVSVNVCVCVCVCSRVGVYVTTFQTLAGDQEKFHKEMSKVS